MKFLLDVNALLAMKYTNHVHYERVDRWVTQLEAEHRQDSGPLMVRHEAVNTQSAVPPVPGASDRSGSRGIAIR